MLFPYALFFWTVDIWFISELVSLVKEHPNQYAYHYLLNIKKIGI